MFIKNNECSWIVRKNSSQFFSRYYTDGCFVARFFTAKAEKLPNFLVHFDVCEKSAYTQTQFGLTENIFETPLLT